MLPTQTNASKPDMSTHPVVRRWRAMSILLRSPTTRWVLSIATLATVIGLTYVRLYLGVDLTDESFYVAIPYRFVLGARPLIDETTVQQLTPGVLLYPFVALYHAAAGLEGLVLFMRHLHFVFCLAVSAVLFTALRRRLHDAALSAVLSISAVAFVPFGIHGLSYNTFASGFFTAGCFVGVAWLADPRRRSLILLGTLFGLAIFTYPTFVVPAALYFFLLYRASGVSIRALTSAVLPTAMCAVATLAFFLMDGVGTARKLFEQTNAYGGQGGGIGKAADIATSLGTAFPHKYFALGLLLLAVGLGRWRRWAAVLPVLALPLTALPPELNTSASSNEFVANFALLAPGVFLLIPRSSLARALLGLTWIPAVVAGALTAWASSNGSINFAIGAFPAAVTTATLSAMVVRDALSDGGSRNRRSAIELVPAIALVCAGVTLQYLFVYRDTGLSHLTSRVETGAYAGLYTTPLKRQFIRDLSGDLQSFSGARCRVLFYDAFPAGYLLGNGQPETNTVWLSDVTGDRETALESGLLSYYARRHTLPDVAVRIDRFPLSDTTAAVQHYRATDPLEELFRSRRYVTVRTRPDYRLRVRANTRCNRHG